MENTKGSTKAKAKGKPSPKRKVSAIIKWSGGASEALGIGALMLMDYFWLGVVLIYIGFSLLLVAIWREQVKIVYRIVASVLIIGVGIGFTFGIVLVKAPLGVQYLSTTAEYPHGTVIAGINWEQYFSEFDVFVNNPSSHNYDDVEITIQLDVPIAEIKQDGTIPDVTFEDREDMTIRQMLMEEGKEKMNPLSLLATDIGYKVHCRRLFSGSELKLVLALVDLRWCPVPNMSIFDKNYMLRFHSKEGTDWYGHTNTELYIPHPTAHWLEVSATYITIHRTRNEFQHLNVVTFPAFPNAVPNGRASK